MVLAGANVNRVSEHNGETALHGVAGGSDARGVRLLLENGARTRTPDETGNVDVWLLAGRTGAR